MYQESNNIVNDFASAFAGAFFAFLFIRLAAWLKDRRERKIKNRRALGKIQLICNINYGTLSDSLFVIDWILKVIKDAEEKKQLPFSANRLDKLSIVKDVLLDIDNTDFLNDYFSYIVTLEKHNNDIDSINQFHESMKMAKLGGKITPENYVENMNRLAKNLNVYKKFCVDTMEKTEIILAKSRVLLLREKSLIERIFSPKSKLYSRGFKKKLIAELEMLKKEMEFVKEKSRADMNKIISAE